MRAITIGKWLVLGLVLGLAVTLRAAEDAPRGIFFEVDDGSAYLLGSVHVAKPELYPLAPAIQRAFDNAEALVLEARTGLEAAGERQARMLEAARYPPGDSLRQSLTPETRSLFEEHASRVGPAANMLNQFKPWFVTVALTMPALQNLGYSPFHGVDRYFEHKVGDKRIVTLESLEEQIALFESMSDETQDLMLRETLVHMDELEPMMEQTFRAWKAGDSESLEQVMLSAMKQEEYRPLYEKVILERNREMAGEIDQLIRDKADAFVVIGAGHLIGEDSVVEHLRDRGYNVTQIK